MKRYHVGLIGCGVISSHYLHFAKTVYSDYFEITAVADIIPERARTRAEEYGIAKYGTPDIILEDDTIDLVINLTVPMVHEEVSLQILESGKHLYTEKPLATDRAGMRRILDKAEEMGKRVGSAPDTFMNAPAQTAKKVLEEDWIGAPIGINAICPMRGNEFHRPDADFFYQKGAGPMMDMAAYYLNQMVNLFGSVESVMTMAKITFPERTIKVQPRRGEKIKVEVPTYVSSNLRFENGVIATFVNSFDIWGSKQPYIEVYGEKGTMVMPDPNRYVGDVLVRRFNGEWKPAQQFVEYSEYGRGIGIVDMIRSMEAGVPHKASGELAYHVNDVILAMDEACHMAREIKIASRTTMPEGLWKTPETILWK